MPYKYNPLLSKLLQEVSPKSNFSATSNPGVTDDSGKGYEVGSEWANIITNKAYICLDATTGAAVWTETTSVSTDPPFERTGTIILPKITTDTLKLLNPNNDAFIIGSPTEEGGDIKIYRNNSGNCALSLNTDAASNEEGLHLFAGVVIDNYLTLGQSTLSIGTYRLYINGQSWFTSIIHAATVNSQIGHGFKTSYAGYAARDGEKTTLVNNVVTSGTNDHKITLCIDSNEIMVIQATGNGAGGIISTSQLVQINGSTHMSEIVTPSAIANYGAIYPKSNDILYFQDGAGNEHIIGGATQLFKSFHATTQGLGANPDVYVAGFYEAPIADADLTQANLTQTYGTVNKSQAAHAFLVASAAGTTDGSNLVITVSGISITDAGVRNAADSEVIVTDATAMATNQYYETTKKWLGQITYTLSSAGGAVFASTFNYGFCKYEDYGNRDFKVTDLEAVGFAGANDTDFDIILFHHSSTGWTYNAAAFVPGGTKITQLSTVHSTDDQLIASEHFAYKLTSLTTDVDGSGSEGVIVKIISTANNAVEFVDIHIGVEI